MDLCECGAEIVQPATGRKRRKCSTCSPPDKRERRQPNVTAFPGGNTATPARRRSVYAVTLAELEAAERVDSADGAVALHLAQLLDDGQYNAQGAAALAKAHAESLTRALKGVAGAASVVDQLRRRRDTRRTG